MAEAEIRVGLIGAGGNVRNRHIPGFQKWRGWKSLRYPIEAWSPAAVSQTSSIFRAFIPVGKTYWRIMI
jgi:hypothetical protein